MVIFMKLFCLEEPVLGDEVSTGSGCSLLLGVEKLSGSNGLLDVDDMRLTGSCNKLDVKFGIPH